MTYRSKAIPNPLYSGGFSHFVLVWLNGQKFLNSDVFLFLKLFFGCETRFLRFSSSLKNPFHSGRFSRHVENTSDKYGIIYCSGNSSNFF